MQLTSPEHNENNRRLYAGMEALKLPYGGVSYISQLFGCTHDTRFTGSQGIE